MGVLGEIAVELKMAILRLCLEVGNVPDFGTSQYLTPSVSELRLCIP